MYNMFIKYLSLFIQVLMSPLFIQAETNTKCGTSAAARKSYYRKEKDFYLGGGNSAHLKGILLHVFFHSWNVI